MEQEQRPTESLASSLGDTRGNYGMRDASDGMGNFSGRVMVQRLFASLKTAGVQDKARARAPEYIH